MRWLDESYSRYFSRTWSGWSINFFFVSLRSTYSKYFNIYYHSRHFLPSHYVPFHLITSIDSSYSNKDLSICAHRYLSSVKRNRPLINRPFKKWRSTVRSITRLAARDTLVYTQRRAHAKEEGLALDCDVFH